MGETATDLNLLQAMDLVVYIGEKGLNVPLFSFAKMMYRIALSKGFYLILISASYETIGAFNGSRSLVGKKSQKNSF